VDAPSLASGPSAPRALILARSGRGDALVEPGHVVRLGAWAPAGAKTRMSLVPAAHVIPAGLPRPVLAVGHGGALDRLGGPSARSILLTWANRP
jgi:hypothetical protein